MYDRSVDPLDVALLPLARRVKLLRLYAGDSVAAVATRWGKSSDYVYSVERDERPPEPPQLKDLMDRAQHVSEQLAAQLGVAPPSRRDPADVLDEVMRALESHERRQKYPGGRKKRRSPD